MEEESHYCFYCKRLITPGINTYNGQICIFCSNELKSRPETHYYSISLPKYEVKALNKLENLLQEVIPLIDDKDGFFGFISANNRERKLAHGHEIFSHNFSDNGLFKASIL